MAALLISYSLFGAGYIAFMTFVVAYLRIDRQAATDLITWFGLTLGVAGLAIGLTVMAPLSRFRGGHAMAVLIGVTTIGSVLALLSSNAPGTIAAAILFGTFFSVSAAATESVRQRRPPHEWPAAIAGLTAGFGVGQCFGPILGEHFPTAPMAYAPACSSTPSC